MRVRNNLYAEVLTNYYVVNEAITAAVVYLFKTKRSLFTKKTDSRYFLASKSYSNEHCNPDYIIDLKFKRETD